MAEVYGLTDEGFNRKPLTIIKSELEDALRAKLGNSINLQPPSIFSVLVGIFSERESLLWEGLENLYNSSYPDTAEGVSLDNAVAYTGITRLAATYSTIDVVHLFGTVGTLIPAGTQFSVDGNADAQFETLTAVTLVAGTDEVQTITFSATPVSGSFRLSYDGEDTSLFTSASVAADIQTALNALDGLSGVTVTGSFGAGFVVTFAGDDGKVDQPLLTALDNTLNGSITITVTETTPGVPQGVVACQAVDVGAIQAPARTLTVIDTPVSGLDRVINYNDAAVGTETETDVELRRRRAESLQVAGAATLNAIFSRIRNLDGVIGVSVYENDSDVTDGSGRPPHSFEVIVQGGDDQVIADEIFDAKAVGIKTYGNQSETVTDTQGITHTINFSRPTSIPIFIELDLTVNSEFPVDGIAQVKAAMVSRGTTTFNVGDDVVVYPTLIGILDEVAGITDVVIRVGIAANPTLDNNIPIADAEIPTFDTANVEVTIL